MPQLATLHALHIFLSAVSWKPAAQVTQPWQASTFITVQLTTAGHYKWRDSGTGSGQEQ